MKLFILLLLSFATSTIAFYELAYLLVITEDGSQVHPSCRFENETDTLHQFADEVLAFIFLGNPTDVDYYYLGDDRRRRVLKEDIKMENQRSLRSDHSIDDGKVRELSGRSCSAPPFCRLPEYEEYCVLLGCPRNRRRKLSLFFEFAPPDEYETLEEAMEDAIVVPLSSYVPFNPGCDPNDLSMLIFVQPEEGVEAGDVQGTEEDWTANWEAWKAAHAQDWGAAITDPLAFQMFLFDPYSGNDIMELYEGAVVDRSALGTDIFNIRTGDIAATSVIFHVNGYYMFEDYTTPFTMGDSHYYYRYRFSPGHYAMDVNPVDGHILPTVTFSFTVV